MLQFPMKELTADQKDALQGTSGEPNDTNRYVTKQDSSQSDDRVASGIRTATTIVAVSTATAPTAGQTLVATSASAAEWQTPASGVQLTSDTPTTVDRSAAATGTAGTAARADHKHTVSTAAPVSVGASNTEGSSTALARADHTHNHGVHTSGTAHAVAVANGNNGFMSGADKATYDNHVANTGIHAPLNDSITTTSNIWSASKTQQQINDGVTTLISLNALKFRYYADQLDFPRSTDWAVNAGAPSARDTTYPALTVRRFDDSAIEGVGFSTVFPLLVTDMLIRIKAKAITAPPAARNVIWRLYWRRFPNNSTPTAWSNLTLPAMVFQANTNVQYFSYTAPLTTWGITAGDFTQFELVRVGNDINDTLTGDAALLSLELEYS